MSSHGFLYPPSSPPLPQSPSTPSTNENNVYGDDISTSANITHHSATFNGRYMTALSAHPNTWSSPIQDSRGMASPAGTLSSYSSLHSPVERNEQTYTLADALQTMSSPAITNASYPESSQRTAMASNLSDTNVDSPMPSADTGSSWSAASYSAQMVGVQSMNGDHHGPPPPYARNATARAPLPMPSQYQNTMVTGMDMHTTQTPHSAGIPSSVHSSHLQAQHQQFIASGGGGNTGDAFAASATTLNANSYPNAATQAAYSTTEYQTPASHRFQPSHSVVQGSRQGHGSEHGHSHSPMQNVMQPPSQRSTPMRASWAPEGHMRVSVLPIGADQGNEQEIYDKVYDSPGDANFTTTPVHTPSHLVDYGAYGQSAGYFAAVSQGHSQPKHQTPQGPSKPEIHYTQNLPAHFFSNQYTSPQSHSRSHTLAHAIEADVSRKGSLNASIISSAQRPRALALDDYTSISRPSIGMGADLPGSASLTSPAPFGSHLPQRPQTASSTSPPPTASSATSTSSVPSHALSSTTSSSQGSQSSTQLQTHRSVKVTLPSTTPGEPGRKVKMHECNICQKLFPRPSGLATHMNSHSGLRPFKCPLDSCNKTFAVRSNARRHLRTHGIVLNPTSKNGAGTGGSIAGGRNSSQPFQVGFETPVVVDVHDFNDSKSGNNGSIRGRCRGEGGGASGSSRQTQRYKWVPQSLAEKDNFNRLRSLSPVSDMVDLDEDDGDGEDEADSGDSRGELGFDGEHEREGVGLGADIVVDADGDANGDAHAQMSSGDVDDDGRSDGRVGVHQTNEGMRSSMDMLQNRSLTQHHTRMQGRALGSGHVPIGDMRTTDSQQNHHDQRRDAREYDAMNIDACYPRTSLVHGSIIEGNAPGSPPSPYVRHQCHRMATPSFADSSNSRNAALDLEVGVGMASGLAATGSERSDNNAQTQVILGVGALGCGSEVHSSHGTGNSQQTQQQRTVGFCSYNVTDPLDPVTPSDPQVTSDVNMRFEERNSYVEAGTYPYHPQQWKQRLPGPRVLISLQS